MPAVSQDNDIAGFFAHLEAVHALACRRTGVPQTECFSLAGNRLALTFAGDALPGQLLPALRHLSAGNGSSGPELQVALWDSVASGEPMPSPPWSLDDCVERGEVRGYNDERFRTAYFLGSGVLNMLDRRHGKGLFWLRDANRLALWESGAPLLALLNWWFSGGGRQLVHAAAVGYPEGGILLAGRGGSGKSTTALACLETDLLYAGDDYCLLETAPDTRVHSLYNSAKLNCDNLRRFPTLGRLFDLPSARIEEKALVFLQERLPEKLTGGFPLKGIFLPRVTGQKSTSLERVSPAAAMRALAPSTLFQLCGAGREGFAVMATLVRQVPCFQLHLGTDLSGVTGTIRRYLQGGKV